MLRTTYVTHGHGDHFFGLGALLDRFPTARGVATAVWQATRAGLAGQLAASALPEQIPETLVTEPLQSD